MPSLRWPWVLIAFVGACNLAPERPACLRDGQCPEGQLCYVDGACLKKAEASRLPVSIGTDCVATAGVELGCREGAFCRLGWCVRAQPPESLDGAIVDDASSQDASTDLCVDQVDNGLPLFGGISEALVDGPDAVILRWFPAADETPPDEVVYLIHASTSSVGLAQTSPLAMLTGLTSYRASGLTAGTTYYFHVRAQDGRGLIECNEKVLAATPTTGPDCIDYARDIQPIFEANCVRCHGGAMPRQALRLESFEGVWAGGVTGTEVVACQPQSSLVFLKIALETPPVGVRMPYDGPPYLTETQIGRVEQWIREGGRRTCAEPSICSDQSPPTFAGLATAITSSDGLGAELCWTAGGDDQTAPGALVYDVYEATSSGGQRFTSPPKVTSPPGASCLEVRGLTPMQEHCWVVRARDAAGNRDANVVEECLTMPAASCIDYRGVVQPIFDAHCTRCHSGPTAPRNLDLSGYAGVIAGGLSGGEVVSCRAQASLLFQKISMAVPPIGDRMPKDGPPYLAQAQIDIIAQWIDEGARLSCADPDLCSDAVPPTFAGVTSLTPLDATRVELCWAGATDNLTPGSGMIYEVYVATSAGAGDFAARPRVTTAAGQTCATVPALSPDQNYCFVVRARDGAGNRDANAVELCHRTATLPSCIDYDTMVQPLFDYHCTRCHSGAAAPQFLRLDSYANLLAGSVRRSEVVGCNGPASLLLGKISASPPLGRRMPFDGPPFLTTGQEALLGQWVAEGVRRSCVEASACTDTSAPAFAGITSVSAVASTTVRVCWSPATDDHTPVDSIRYEIFEASAPGTITYGLPAPHAIVGQTCYDVPTGPNTSLCFVVRASDRRGHRDTNTIELCAGTANVGCGLEYAADVSPILKARCGHCHFGVNPPRFLDLSSYGAMLAGGALRQEVVACRPSDSYLSLKVGGATCGQRMPFDGPPYLAASQRAIIDRWIGSGARLTCADPDPCSDVSAPTFAGLTNATAIDGTTVELSWSLAGDNTSGADRIAYDIYDATTAASFNFGAPAGYAAPAGATSARVRVLPDAQTCFVVRAKDLAGNRDTNAVSRCLTPPGVCVPYEDLVQPIFDARCIQCHSGANPPRGIRWDSYAHAAANDEVRVCDAESSKIVDEVDGCTMPRDTTTQCSVDACLTVSQRRLISAWIDTGASPGCPAAGCP